MGAVKNIRPSHPIPDALDVKSIALTRPANVGQRQERIIVSEGEWQVTPDFDRRIVWLTHKSSTGRICRSWVPFEAVQHAMCPDVEPGT